jgi:hypothetical protein
MCWHCWRDATQSCDSAVVICWHCWRDVTALSIMRQCCWSCDSASDGTVNMMWQRCWSSNSDILDVLALLTWCDSAVDHATVLLLLRWRRRRDVTVLSIMQQCHCWCVGAVDVTQQRSWSCISAVNHVTVPLLMWQHCWHDVTALLIRQQCHRCRVRVVNMLWQCCQSRGRAVLDVLTWRDNAVNHATALLIIRQSIKDVTALSTWCDSTVNHAVTSLTALSCDEQHIHMLNSYFVQLTTKLFKGQCHHMIDSDDVTIVIPGCPLYVLIKHVCLCTKNRIRAQ